MAGPSVVATIEGRDLFTAVLEKTLRDAHGKSAAFAAEQERQTRLATDAHARQAERMRMVYDGANAAMMAAATKYGAHVIREVMATGKAMENEQRKILSFSDTTVAQMERVRKSVDSTFSTIKGGPEAALEAVRAGVLSGVKAENITAALPVINLHSVETGTSTEHGTESLIGLGNMLNAFHDDMGQVVSAASATREQFLRGLKEAENVAIAANMVAPGSLQSQVDAIRVAAPVAQGLNIPRADMMAADATLMAAGYGGAQAGQYIKSAMSRAAAPTAAMRSTVASLGMHMSDYQHVNVDMLNDDGVQAGLRQALGTLNDKFKAGLHASLERLRQDHNQEAFHTALVDLIRTDGGKKSPVIASNIAERVMAPAVTGLDFFGLLRGIAEHGGGVGALDAMFGKEVGGALAPLLSAQFADFRTKFQASLQQNHVDHAIDENANSYTARVEGLGNAIKGLEDQLFVGLKPAIEATLPSLTNIVQRAAGASSSVHEVMDAILVGGTAIAGLKTAGTLANIAGGLERFALGAEAASPFIAAVGTLASIEFLPAVAGLALLTGGIEAFIHRAEIAHALDLHNRDDFDRPDNAEQAAALAAKRDSDMAIIAERQRNASREELNHDPILDDLNARRLSMLADLGVQYGDTPALRAAQDARDRAGRENPLHDPEMLKARDDLYNVHDALQRRDAVTDRHIAALQRYIEQHRGEDPSAGDADLDRMKQRRAELRSSLPTPDAMTPELETLNDRIAHRESFNREELQRQIDAANKLLEDAKDAAGAPKVAPGDLDAAKARYEAAKAGAQARHDAEIARADAAVAQAKAEAEAAVKARPEVVSLQRQIDDRQDYVRAHLPEDDEVTRRLREVANADRALERYRNEVEAPQRLAYDQTHPAFLRPENAPGAQAAADYMRPVVPRAGLSAFGLNGPQADLSGVASQLRAMLYPNGQPGTPQGPQKVDVNSKVDVSGKVTGTIEGSAKVDVEVKPSPMFLATMRRAEMLARVAIDGNMSGKGPTDMGGPNGINYHPAALGIGHM